VRVAVRKLEGVESVEVSLERASADIRLRPANRVTMAQLRQIIKNNGFSAKDATVTAVGTLVERGGKPALDVTGIDAVWLLTSPGAENNSAYLDAVQRIKSQQSGSIEVVGTIAASTTPNQPEELAVQVLKPAPK
jgi:copper chaperone CopZ